MYGDIFVASNIKKVVTDIGTEATSYGNNLLSYDNIYFIEINTPLDNMKQYFINFYVYN
mgnify:FL=1